METSRRAGRGPGLSENSAIRIENCTVKSRSGPEDSTATAIIRHHRTGCGVLDGGSAGIPAAAGVGADHPPGPTDDPSLILRATKFINRGTVAGCPPRSWRSPDVPGEDRARGIAGPAGRNRRTGRGRIAIISLSSLAIRPASSNRRDRIASSSGPPASPARSRGERSRAQPLRPCTPGFGRRRKGTRLGFGRRRARRVGPAPDVAGPGPRADISERSSADLARPGSFGAPRGPARSAPGRRRPGFVRRPAGPGSLRAGESGRRPLAIRVVPNPGIERVTHGRRGLPRERPPTLTTVNRFRLK